MLRFIDDGISWHITYATSVDQVSISTEADDAVATEAREFFRIIEGTVYERSADSFLSAMTAEPEIRNITEGFYWVGTEAIRTMVNLYPETDDIWCGDDILVNGPWSAEPITIDNPPYHLSQVGMMVHYHQDGKVDRQYVHFTRTSGDLPWMLPLEPQRYRDRTVPIRPGRAASRQPTVSSTQRVPGEDMSLPIPLESLQHLSPVFNETHPQRVPATHDAAVDGQPIHSQFRLVVGTRRRRVRHAQPRHLP